MTSPLPPSPFIRPAFSNMPLFPGWGQRQEQPIPIPKLPTTDLCLGKGSFIHTPRVPSWESGEGGSTAHMGEDGVALWPCSCPLGDSRDSGG